MYLINEVSKRDCRAQKQRRQKVLQGLNFALLI